MYIAFYIILYLKLCLYIEDHILSFIVISLVLYFSLFVVYCLFSGIILRHDHSITWDLW